MESTEPARAQRAAAHGARYSDGILSADIPLLQVLPEYQGQGIGTELLRRMLETLGGLYALDIVCDEALAPFYAARGFGRCVGMVRRNVANQDGTPPVGLYQTHYPGAHQCWPPGDRGTIV